MPGRPAGMRARERERERRATCFSSAAVRKTDKRNRGKCNQKEPKTYEAFFFLFPFSLLQTAQCAALQRSSASSWGYLNSSGSVDCTTRLRMPSRFFSDNLSRNITHRKIFSFLYYFVKKEKGLVSLFPPKKPFSFSFVISS